MADMDFKLVLEAVVKGQAAVDKLTKSEEQIAKAAKASGDASAAGANKAEQAMRREAEAMRHVETASKGLSAAGRVAAVGANEQARAADRVAIAETKAAAATRAHGEAAAKAGRVYRGVSADAEKAAKAAEREEARAAKRITAAGAAAGVAVAGAAAGFVGMGVKNAISRESAIAEVVKRGDLTPAQAAAAQALSDRMGRKYGMPANDVTALQGEAFGAGIDRADMERFVELAVKASKAWNMSASEAAESLAKVRANTRFTMAELEDFADKASALERAGSSKARDVVSGFLNPGSSAAAAAGLSPDAFNAAQTALQNTGMEAGKAGNFLGFFAQRLQIAGESGKTAAEGFKMLGLDAKGVQEGMKTKPLETVRTVLDALGKSSDAASAGVKIFGREWSDEAAKLAQIRPEFEKMLALLGSGGWKGTLQQGVNIELETTQSRLNRINELTAQIAAHFMSWSLGPINQAAEWLLAKLEKVDALISKFQGVMQGGILPPAVVPVDRDGVAARRNGLSIDDYEKRWRLNSPPSSTPSAPMAPQGANDNASKAAFAGRAPGNIVALGRQLQAEGLRVSEHPAFGGVHPVHHGHGHYEGRAIDVNVGRGVFEAGNAAAGAKFDALAAQLRGQGYTVIWRAPGHFDHMHVETPRGFGRNQMFNRAAPRTGIVSPGDAKPAGQQSGAVIHYSPSIKIAGGDAKSKQEFSKQLSDHARHIASLVDRENGRRGRLSFHGSAA